MERISVTGVSQPFLSDRSYGSMHDAGDISAGVAEMLDDVRKTMECDPERARAAALQLVSLLTLSAETRLSESRGALAPWQMHKISKYLKSRVRCAVSIDQLAAQVSLSVSYFGRAFKKSFGQSPHAYIISMRLELAQELMLSTHEPLAQIAVACGFSDQSHLTRLFRRVVGKTPRDWRRLNINDGSADAGIRRMTEES